MPDIFRINEVHEAVPVGLCHIIHPVGSEEFTECDVLPDSGAVDYRIIRPVTDPFIRIQINIIYTTIIRGHGRDHLGLLVPLLLLGQQFFLEPEFFLQFLLPGLRSLDPGHLRHIHAHAQGAEPAGFIGKFHLGGLQVPDSLAAGIRHILKEDVRFIHIDRLLVILNEMVCRILVKDIMVSQSDHALRRILVGILGKGLVAGQIFPCFCILGKAHGRHIGKEGCHRTHQVCQLSGGLHFLHQPHILCFLDFSLLQSLLDPLAFPHIIVHVLKAADNTHLAAGHIDPGKFDAEITLAAIIHGPQIVDIKLRLLFKTCNDRRKLQFLLEPVTVRRSHGGIDIILLGHGIFHPVQGIPDRRGMGRIPGNIAPVK